MQTPLVCLTPEIVTWVNEHRLFIRMKVYLKTAASRSDLEFLTWVHSQNYFESFEAAAEGGHVHVMKYLLEQQPIRSFEMACRKVVMNGHLPVLEWLLSECHELEQILYVFGSELKDCHLPTIHWFVDKYNWLQ